VAMAADRVAVLEGARLVEADSPEALIRAGGTFARLFASAVARANA
jgi:ABC-type multidrug transport system fused ATPase/permease subunit